jgi:hypothetical protein
MNESRTSKAMKNSRPSGSPLPIDDRLFRDVAVWAKGYKPWRSGDDYDAKVAFLKKSIQGRVDRFVAQALVRCSPDSVRALMGVLKVASRGRRSVDGFIENMAWGSYESNWGWAAGELFGDRQSTDQRLVSVEEAVFLTAVTSREPFLLLYYWRSDFGSAFSRYAVKRLREMVARYWAVLGSACDPAPHPVGLSKYWPDDDEPQEDHKLIAEDEHTGGKRRGPELMKRCEPSQKVPVEMIPPILSPQQTEDWQELLKAASEDRLMAVRMPLASGGKPEALVCSVVEEGPNVTFNPLAKLFEQDAKRTSEAVRKKKRRRTAKNQNN